MTDQGYLNQAEAQLRNAIAQNPNNATAHVQLGNLLRQQSNRMAALHSFQTALKLDPKNAAVHGTLGVMLAEQDDWDAAATHLRQAIALSPKTVSYYVNLGYVLRSQGKVDEALEQFRAASKLNPKHAPVHNGLGLVLMDQGDLKKAATHFRQAIGFNPKDADAHHNLGLVLKRQGNMDEAIASFQAAIAVNSNHVMALTNLGLALQDQDKLEEAIRTFRKAVGLNPQDAAVQVCLGNAYHEQGNLEKAAVHLKRAIALNPNDACAHLNVGNLLGTQGKPDQAIEAYQKAIQLQPDFAEAHIQLAQSLLLTGDLLHGFVEYEWRWAMIPPPHFAQPVWDGSDLNGKTILVWVEAGFGDIIQFIRYVPLLKTYGGRVIVTYRPPLKRLLERMEGIDQLILEGDTLPEFDVHVPLMNLPQIMGTMLETIPAQIPYLFPPVEAVTLEPLPNTTLKVGIVWASGYKTVGGLTTKITDRILLKSRQLRSCPLEIFTKLLAIAGISFYSLQVGENVADLATLDQSYQLQDLSPHIQDFADTAAFISQMDFIISVDTAVAHLAGALGKPVWVLLPVAADWRWLLNRDDTPWYPTVRLFRQPSPGDWDAVLTQATEALQGFVHTPYQR